MSTTIPIHGSIVIMGLTVKLKRGSVQISLCIGNSFINNIASATSSHMKLKMQIPMFHLQYSICFTTSKYYCTINLINILVSSHSALLRTAGS